MRWLVILSASKADVERLRLADIDGITANPDDPSELLLTTEISDDDGGVARTEIEAFVDRINGVGRLRWGRVFEGVSIQKTISFDGDGQATVVWVDAASAHLLPEDFANLAEALGLPRPPMPKGLEIIEALDLAAVAALAETAPQAMRGIHLVDLMLRGHDEIDWVAGYAALEVVEQDLRHRGFDGPALGFWNKKELRGFKATANSPEVLGYRARHGKDSGLTEARMATVDASWFIRRVVASWLIHLLDEAPDAEPPNDP